MKADPTTDGALLQRFAQKRDRKALETLISRHAPLVHSTCKRILGDAPEVKEAFQNTFQGLLKNAAPLTSLTSIDDLLYQAGVTQSLGIRKAKIANSPVPAQTSEPQADVVASQENGWNEICPVLDEELKYIIQKHRLPIVLRFLKGMPSKEAASQLNLTESSFESQLGRGEELLEERLAERGIPISKESLHTLLENIPHTADPTLQEFIQSTVQIVWSKLGKSSKKTNLPVLISSAAGIILILLLFFIFKPSNPQKESSSNPPPKLQPTEVKPEQPKSTPPSPPAPEPQPQIAETPLEKPEAQPEAPPTPPPVVQTQPAITPPASKPETKPAETNAPKISDTNEAFIRAANRAFRLRADRYKHSTTDIVFERWVKKDPLFVSQWILTENDTVGRSFGVQCISKYWKKLDPVAEEKWEKDAVKKIKKANKALVPREQIVPKEVRDLDAHSIEEIVSAMEEAERAYVKKASNKEKK